MTSAGYGIQRSRRLRVLVNPHGGVVRHPAICYFICPLSYEQKKGAIVFSTTIEPIFRAAGCQLHITRVYFLTFPFLALTSGLPNRHYASRPCTRHCQGSRN